MAKRKISRKHSKSPAYKSGKVWFFIVVACLAAAFFVFNNNQNVTSTAKPSVEGANTGFDQYGYNDTARLFNGTGSSWCLAKKLDANCMGIYSPDKLVMKWTADWDRGNLENWGNPPYNKAWTDNEWNGKVAGGSGAVWHYKIVWDQGCTTNGTPSTPGGYCIWGQFETIMDQGTDPNLGPGHLWYTKATPAGYGAYGKP